MINIQNEKYLCNCCGSCCKMMNDVKLPDSLQDKLNRGDGVCKYLLSNNKCSIYNNRPDFCNSDKVYMKYFSHMNKKEFNDFMYEQCKKIRAKMGIK